MTNDLDELFISKDPNSIKSFLDSFDSVEDIIKWSRNRPRAQTNIHVIDGDPRVAVVIPTADIKGKYANEARKIFDGLSIVFVESRGQYFNFAHSVNMGIREALKLDPEWIVVSNDDMIMIDKSDVLVRELEKVKGVEVVFTPQSDYHSIPVYICKLISHMLYSVYAGISYNPLELRYIFYLSNIRRRFGIKYDIFGDIGRKGIEKKLKLICRKIYKIVNGGSFIVFSSSFVKKIGAELLDETYINGYEDVDLYFRIFYQIKPRFGEINYKIGDIIRGSLERDLAINFKNGIINLSYFNYKFYTLLK
ncbi:hypothetical protein GFS03_04020 [Sulfolobus sp. E5-1-F]|uniref:hypothetical protein n=1 Tax=Saccharolobus sp. E5-1-F TaxID=2663019 RepID=UPI0012976AE4|nr:hypothetical protein [Sulfolobus sp. E5-1-F]QGA53809.1 hypothetical protein GFS03_04020 [Sulfolobus sp. E5-1-F]